MAIIRFALANPSANTDTLIYTADRNSISSVIATNKSTSAASVRIWVIPQGATIEAEYAFLCYDTIVPANNSLETFRFSFNNDDELYVRSSTSNVSFYLNGIYESNGNQYVTVSSTAPSNPTIGDIWINQTNDDVYFWNGSEFVLTTAPKSKYQTTMPDSPVEGQIWVDSDDDLMYIYDGTLWVLITTPASSYQSSEPIDPLEGQIWIDSDTDFIYVWSGSAWVQVGGSELPPSNDSQSIFANRMFG